MAAESVILQILLALAAPVAPVPLAQAIAPAIPAETNAYCHIDFANVWPRQLCIASDTYDADVCRAIELYAEAAQLPEGYFARLVWQESRFNLNALSPAGAQGIAQFMPGTARLRGLENAFNPAEALARSAEYLQFLEEKFGNLGLAAAAYNSGEGRTERYTSSGGYLPPETRDYVQIITGHDVDQWLLQPPQDVDYSLDPTATFSDACLQLASTRRIAPFDVPEEADWEPWGVQVAADFSPQVAQRMFDRVQARFASIIGDEAAMLIPERNPSFGAKPRYHARIGRQTREEALELCQALQAAGGTCLVVEN